MTDFIFMVHETSHMFITGPDVVKTVTARCDPRAARRSREPRHALGCGHLRCSRREGVPRQVRYLLSFLPSNNLETPPDFEEPEDLDAQVIGLRDVVPDSPNQPMT